MKISLVVGFCAVMLWGSAALAQDQPGELVPPTSASDFTAGQLDGAIAGNWRSDANKARDAYRHPKETLQFFGVQPDQTVIEINPSGGWFAEILAPLLRDNGHYIGAQPDAKSAAALKAKFAANPAAYGAAKVISYDEKVPVFGAPASADVVLTFRNVHNWTDDGTAAAMFKAFYAVLKDGGTLGIEDHRAKSGTSIEQVRGSGYLPVPYVIKLATDAGFQLQEQSEINANPKDSKDYPKGVWTLPPTYALGQQDRAKYQAIGESDRMTLRFIKVAHSAATTSAH